MNNLPSHYDIFYVLVIPVKLQPIKNDYLRKMCLLKKTLRLH